MKIPKILIFNFFTKQPFNKVNSLQIFGRRLNSMSLDFSFTLGLAFPVYAVLIIPILVLNTSLDKTSFMFPFYLGIVPFSFFSFLIINKDYFKAKSVAKRHYGYQIVDSKTNLPASELQCVIRNSTMIIWPIEVIISMFNSSKRLGDLITGIKLIDAYKEDPELIMNEIHQKKNIENKGMLLWISIFIALIFSFISILPVISNLI